MVKDNRDVIVNVGGNIEIISSGLNIKGVVTVAHWWSEDGWDIELTDANVSGGYCRWKQWADGGNLVRVNGNLVGAGA